MAAVEATLADSGNLLPHRHKGHELSVLLLIFALDIGMLEVKAQAEHILGKHSTTKLYSKPKAF